MRAPPAIVLSALLCALVLPLAHADPADLLSGADMPGARLAEKQVSALGNGKWREASHWEDPGDPVFPHKRVEVRFRRVAGEVRVERVSRMLGDRLLVEVTDPDFPLAELIRAHGLEEEGRRAFSPVFRLRLPGNSIAGYERVLKALQRAAGQGGIRVYRDYLAQPAAVPNDPRYAVQQTDLALIRAPAAWDITTGSAETVVVVIDSGIDATHPDLPGNLFSNPAEIPGNGIDDDGNGLVDDVSGWDFHEDDNTPGDSWGHGTQMAGIIAARGNNAIGMAGTVWRAQILPLKVGDNEFSWSAIIQAIDYAIWMKEQGVPVAAINNSYGGTIANPEDLQPLAAAVTRAEAAGILFVAAAGNQGRDNDAGVHFYPSDLPNPNVLSVASTTISDALSASSNYGTVSVDLAAPGTGVLATKIGGGYGTVSGTSASCARVSGIAALLHAEYPELDFAGMRGILINTGVVRTSLIGKLANPVRVDMAAAAASAREFRILAPFNSWREAHWGPAFAELPEAATLADPDRDGLSNLWEYALGGNPLAASAAAEAGARPRPVLFESSGQLHLGFELRLRAGDPGLQLFLEEGMGQLNGAWAEPLSVSLEAAPDPGLPGFDAVRIGLPIDLQSPALLRLGLRFHTGP
jgi:subtilisin family serine protease